MVLGPEFVPLAGLTVAAVHRRPAHARRAATTLVLGFVVAIGLTACLTLVGRGLGWFGTELLALGGGREFGSAATQLGINLSGILVAATLTLALQRTIWRRIPGVVPRVGADRR